MRVSRRRFLELVGATAGVAALGAGLGAADAATSRAEGKAAKAAPRRLRRWAMVIDLRACDGCQDEQAPPRCTAACIQSRYVPEPMEWIECYEKELPGGGTQFIPTPCQQCQNAPCVNVCPVGATWHTPEGTVLIDQERCIGCRLCMAACPYDRRFFNWGDPPRPPETAFVRYSPENQVGAPRGTVMKCDFCPELARAGWIPYCIQACPHGALYWGDLEEDLATNGKEVVVLSRFLSEHHAYRLKEELGTRPRVYYVPGHGQNAGRDPQRRGRHPTRWPWKGKARRWARSGR
ncbi:MAG: 4Fe-4S dicluster domain-containing protein [Candidatus Rokubacteria bacterium]|nr:4Fe-4S dicluster domain-containing protein [Candidatus Rokubacteria bacterium]